MATDGFRLMYSNATKQSATVVDVTLGGAPPMWDLKLQRLPGANPFQTSSWGAFSASYLLAQPIYFLASDMGGEVQGALLAFGLAPCPPSWLEKPGGSLIIRALRSKLPVISWNHGPLISAEYDQETIANCLQESALSFARRLGALEIRGVTLPIHGADLPPHALLSSFGHGRYEEKSKQTLLIDLRPPEELLWQNLKASARKAIRRAREKGVSVRHLDDPRELAAYHRFVKACRSREGLRSFSARNFTAMWDHLWPRGEMTILVAEQSGEMVGGLGLWGFGDAAIEFTSVQSARAFEEKLYPGDLLKWEALLWAKKEGLTHFDLAGISAEPRSTKEAGIRQFKEKWGGQLVAYSQFSKRLTVQSGALEGVLGGATLARRLIRATRRRLPDD